MADGGEVIRKLEELLGRTRAVLGEPTQAKERAMVGVIYDERFRKAGGLNLDVQAEANGNWSFTIQLRDGRRFRGTMHGEMADVIERALEKCNAAMGPAS